MKTFTESKICGISDTKSKICLDKKGKNINIDK